MLLLTRPSGRNRRRKVRMWPSCGPASRPCRRQRWRKASSPMTMHETVLCNFICVDMLYIIVLITAILNLIPNSNLGIRPELTENGRRRSGWLCRCSRRRPVSRNPKESSARREEGIEGEDYCLLWKHSKGRPVVGRHVAWIEMIRKTSSKLYIIQVLCCSRGSGGWVHSKAELYTSLHSWD